MRTKNNPGYFISHDGNHRIAAAIHAGADPDDAAYTVPTIIVKPKVWKNEPTMTYYLPLAKMDPQLAQHFKTLRAAAPEAASAVANKMMTDHMVPGIGNKLAYEDFLSRPRGGVHVLLDGNDFGTINKRFGQAEGDKAIVSMGNAISAARKQFRGKMFRVGGDEFRLHFDKPEQANGFLRTMRSNLEALPPVQGVHFHSVSAGVGASPEQADQALIHAKTKKKLSGTVPGHSETHVHSLLGGVAEPTPVAAPKPPGITPPVQKSTQELLDMTKAENAFRQELAKMALIHDNAKRPTHVYRIENKNGEGPYRADRPVYSELPDYDRIAGVNSNSTAPGPMGDFDTGDRIQSRMGANRTRFGFLTPQDAENWWGHENLAALRQRGFFLRKVPAAKVWLSRSKKQVMFHPAEVKGKPESPDQWYLKDANGLPPEGVIPPRKVY